MQRADLMVQELKRLMESRFRMRRSLVGSVLVAAVATFTALPAWSQVEDELFEPIGAEGLGLDPTLPHIAAVPAGMVPAYGQRPADQSDWRFDFHGFFNIPLNVGINQRDETVRGSGESKYALHTPPVVPGDKETWSYTGIVPRLYSQMFFSFGNDRVTGNLSLVAEQTSVSSAFFDPPSQAGIQDAFLTVTPFITPCFHLRINVGAFSTRYGVMGEYDEGRMGIPLIARINGVGESMVGVWQLGPNWKLLFEQGIVGQSNKASITTIPDGWNGFADTNEGSTFVNHLHAGLNFKGIATLAGHYVTALSHDDRATNSLGHDGNLRILGADLRLTMGRFGHLYLGFAHTDASYARSISRIIEVLNAPGGPGLMRNYLGEDSRGNGTLTTFGGQYDLSLGTLLSYPVPFTVDGPDIVLSLFGMQTHVTSEQAEYDGITKRKFGAEVSYSLLSWLATSLRWDRVDPNVDFQYTAFSVLSPRVIFRTDWASTDQITLQYSRWFNGSRTTVTAGYPPREDPTVVPDQDMVSLTATMWW